MMSVFAPNLGKIIRSEEEWRKRRPFLYFDSHDYCNFQRERMSGNTMARSSSAGCGKPTQAGFL